MKKYIFSLFLTFWVLSLAAQQQDRRLSPEKLWEIGRLSLETVSPDGKDAYYGVTYYDIAANKSNRDLYRVPLAGGTPKKITAFQGSEWQARFRPDGKKIGYLYQGKLWEMNPDGTDQVQVSDIAMNGFAYAPSGKHLLFIRNVKMDKDVQALYPDLPHAKARIIDDLMYRHWNQWDDMAYSHIFVAPYENGAITGKAKDIMRGERFDSPLNPFGGIEEISWNGDGSAIAYTCKKVVGRAYAKSTNSDIYFYELAKDKTTNLTPGMMGYDREPVFSPDGRYMAWNSMERDGYESDRNRIFIRDMQTGAKEELTQGLDRNANHPHWSADGKLVYFISGEKATQQIFSLDVKSKKVKQITQGEHNFYGFATAGNSLVGYKVSMSHPAELYRIDPHSGQTSQLTFTNQALLNGMDMGKVEKHMVKTSDGKDMLT